MLRRTSDGWMRLAGIIGNFNSRVLLTLVYFLVVAPVGLCARLLSDALALRVQRKSSWMARLPRDTTIENAQRQG